MFDLPLGIETVVVIEEMKVKRAYFAISALLLSSLVHAQFTDPASAMAGSKVLQLSSQMSGFSSDSIVRAAEKKHAEQMAKQGQGQQSQQFASQTQPYQPLPDKKVETSSVTFSSEFEEKRLIQEIRENESRDRKWAAQDAAMKDSGLPIWFSRERSIYYGSGPLTIMQVKSSWPK